MTIEQMQMISVVIGKTPIHECKQADSIWAKKTTKDQASWLLWAKLQNSAMPENQSRLNSTFRTSGSVPNASPSPSSSLSALARRSLVISKSSSSAAWVARGLLESVADIKHSAREKICTKLEKGETSPQKQKRIFRKLDNHANEKWNTRERTIYKYEVKKNKTVDSSIPRGSLPRFVT
jgi:hypothetical protein